MFLARRGSTGRARMAPYQLDVVFEAHLAERRVECLREHVETTTRVLAKLWRE